MNRLSQTLTLLLGVQLLLAIFVFWPADNQSEDGAGATLLSVNADSIDRLSISDSDTALLLQRQDANWIMPEYHNLPVDAAKIARTLNDLPRLPRGWPVASSDGAATRFEVAEDNFQRRVEYFEGDSSKGALFVGTSPGFRKVHTRVGGESPVYAVEYNSFDLPAQPAEWLDKTLLQVGDIQFVSGLDYELSLEGESWNDAEGNTADAASVEALVNGLASLRVTSVADIATAAILDEMNAPPTITVTTTEDVYEYRLFEMEEAYYVQRADIPVFFNLSGFDHNRLNEVNAESLFPVESGENVEGKIGGNDGSES